MNEQMAMRPTRCEEVRGDNSAYLTKFSSQSVYLYMHRAEEYFDKLEAEIASLRAQVEQAEQDGIRKALEAVESVTNPYDPHFAGPYHTGWTRSHEADESAIKDLLPEGGM